jgi:hypothetical protein
MSRPTAAALLLAVALAWACSRDPGAPAYPASEFLFAFDQVAGVPAFTGLPAWNVTDQQLKVLRDEIGANGLRIFVHPAFVGLRQQTWNGPEAFRYSRSAPADYVFDSLDAIIARLKGFGLYPVLQMFPVDVYFNNIYKPDLTAFNDPAAGIDYAGINPKDEVKAFVVAVAGHVAQRFGIRFGINLPELCGSSPDGTLLRGGEQQAWQEIVAAVKAAAPAAEFFGPEICMNLSWVPTVSKYGCGNYSTVYYGTDWPRWDRLENYAQVFDAVNISFYGIFNTWQAYGACTDGGTPLRATTDTDLFILRDHVMPAKWLYGEVGWGSGVDGDPALLGNRTPFSAADDFHFQLASILFGMDHVRGLTVWQVRNNGPTANGLWDVNGEAFPTLADWKVLGPIIGANRSFFATYHPLVNADGLTSDSLQFTDADPAVIVRKLEHHLILYSEGPGEVVLNDVGSASLTPVYSGGSAPTLATEGGSIVVGGLTPHRIYAFAIE